MIWVTSPVDTGHCPIKDFELPCMSMQICRPMKALFYFLTVSVCTALWVACNSDDDEQDKVSCDTFLECNANTLWKLSEDIDGEIYETYLRINDNESNPIEFWTHLFNNECFVHMGMSDVPNMFRITENTRSRFTIRIENLEQQTFRYTMTIQGDVMTIIVDYLEEGQVVETDQVHFNRSTANVNALQLCELDQARNGIWKPR